MTEVHTKTSRRQRPELVQHSIDLITSSQADTGAYPASPTYPPYQYSWLRDGAFIAHAMDLYGQQDSAASFHQWAAATIDTHAHKVDCLQADAPLPDLPLDDRYVRTPVTPSTVKKWTESGGPSSSTDTASG